MEEQGWYIQSKRKKLNNMGPTKNKIWMDNVGKEHVWFPHTLGLTELYQGQVWLFLLEGNNSIKMVEEYILTSAKSKIGNIGGKLLDYNHYYTEKKVLFHVAHFTFGLNLASDIHKQYLEKRGLKSLPRKDKTDSNSWLKLDLMLTRTSRTSKDIFQTFTILPFLIYGWKINV